MGDAIDDALADDEAEEEEQQYEDEIAEDEEDAEIMEEDEEELVEEEEVVEDDAIGISFGTELPEAASGVPMAESSATTAPAKVAEPAVGGGSSDDALSELEARLNNLKR